MTEFVPSEEILAKLSGFPPLMRILLAAPGTLQHSLGAYFGAPVYAIVTRQAKVREDSFIREVALAAVFGNLSKKVVCRASSRITSTIPEVLEQVETKDKGLGQILVFLGLRPVFELQETGADDEIFWRRYTLSAPGVVYEIEERFPRELYEGGNAMEKPWWRSKKLWMAVFASALVFIEKMAGVELEKEYVLGQLAPALTYILGQSFVDGRRRT